MVSSKDAPNDENLTDEYISQTEKASDLYGLIHARFIRTRKGLGLIKEKFLNKVYGYCPRVLCRKTPVLPLGLSEELHYSRMKVSK